MEDLKFTENHFNSNDGMMTSIWGPCLWHSLHTISFNYPINPYHADKIHYFNFFKSLKYVIPCKACRDNYTLNLKKLNFGMHWFVDRYTLSKYIYELHELVNKHLNKQSNLTYEDVRNRFEIFRARCLTDINQYNTSNDTFQNTSNDTSKGCTEPLFGIKSKCVLTIVPLKKKCNTFNISKLCKLKTLKKY